MSRLHGPKLGEAIALGLGALLVATPVGAGTASQAFLITASLKPFDPTGVCRINRIDQAVECTTIPSAADGAGGQVPVTPPTGGSGSPGSGSGTPGSGGAIPGVGGGSTGTGNGTPTAGSGGVIPSAPGSNSGSASSGTGSSATSASVGTLASGLAAADYLNWQQIAGSTLNIRGKGAVLMTSGQDSGVQTYNVLLGAYSSMRFVNFGGLDYLEMMLSW